MSLPRYPEYKDSGVEWLGEVPAHWNVDALRRRAALNPSKSEIRELPGDAMVSFLPMEAVGESGELDLSRTRQISDVLSGYTYFREGDVTFAKITPCFENGKGARMVGLHGGRGFGTTELTVARPNPDLLDSHYLDWVFRSTPFRKRGEAAMYGAGGQKRVPDEFVREFAFGWPSVEEQISIARFLDREAARIDALIAEQETLLALLAEKRQATISHAVTRGLDPNVPMKDSGIAWLGEAPAHWEIFRLGALFREVSEPGREDLPLLSVSIHDGVSDKELGEDELDRKVSRSDDKSKYKAVAVGDLTYNMMRAWQGGFGSVSVDGMVSPAYIVARPKRDFLTTHIESLLRTPAAVAEMKRNSRGITDFRLRLYWEEFKVIQIALPPKQEQAEIAAFIDRQMKNIELLALQAKRNVSLLSERRSALISAAVTGQIDVRGLVSEAAA